MRQKQFKVLLYKMGKVEHYDVMPYFYECWRSKRKYEKERNDKVKTKADLKQWIQDRARYMYWARCEYEFLMANWPFGCKNMYDDLKRFLPAYNIGDLDQDIKFCNIITNTMEKIDVYDQIMMNIDTIVDILYIEFKIDKRNDKRRVVASRGGND